jgi:hypothetical protein
MEFMFGVFSGEGVHRHLAIERSVLDCNLEDIIITCLDWRLWKWVRLSWRQKEQRERMRGKPTGSIQLSLGEPLSKHLA